MGTGILSVFSSTGDKIYTKLFILHHNIMRQVTNFSNLCIQKRHIRKFRDTIFVEVFLQIFIFPIYKIFYNFQD